MSSSEKKLVQWWDSHANKLQSKLDINQLADQISGVSDIVNASSQKLQKVGDWQLSEIEVSLDVKGNILVVCIDGALKLTFKKPSTPS